MIRSTVKRLTEPLDEPKRECRRHRRAALRSHQNKSLAIAGRNLFDDEASSSNNTGPKPPTPPKTLHEHSRPTSSGFQNPITVPTEQTERIINSRHIWLIQNTRAFLGLRIEDPLCRVRHYLSIVDNIHADGAKRDTSSHFFPVGHTSALRDLILRFKQGDGEPIKNDRRKLDQFTQFRFHSLTEKEGWIRIEEYAQYQDDLWDDMSPPRNISSILETIKPTFRGRLSRACNQISYLETPTRKVGLKNPYLISDYCGGSHKDDECKQLNPDEQVCLSGGDIYDDPSLLRFYQNDDTSPWGNSKRKEKGEDGPEWIVRRKFEDELTNFMLEMKSHTKGIGDMLGGTKKERPEGIGLNITQEPAPRPSILYQPSRTSNLPFPSILKKQKKDDEDERILSIFKQIHINLPFLKAMIHMPRGAKVWKDLLSHKEKLEKAASSVKLSKECSAIIQRSLPQKEGDPRSFTLPCLIGPLAVKNALANFGAKMDKDELVLIILGRPFLATARAVIDVHEGKLSLKVGSETITNNIEKSMKSKHSRDDYLYCADHTAKLIQEQWVDTLVEPLEWKASDNRLKPLSLEPPKLKLKELPKHLDPWVSPVQVVPKKGGMTVVKNEEDELIPQWTVTRWRVCINYRKLNNVTQKDHFPLPFIDQMLERLAGHEYYCFLDGFSGYFQILIAPEDQEKTTFTCPYRTFAYKRMPFGLCNALATFQRCMIAIFHELIEDNMEVFIDNFSVFGSSFDNCLKT
ncbi:reverse transcriptase domain-containing protein [Tanacetum coccineum]